MSYKYIDISDMSLTDWTKVFAFCLKKCDFFNISHIYHYDKMDRKSRTLFDVNGAKIEQLWHFDYNFEYINVDADGMNDIRNVYQKLLDTSDFVYLCLPVDWECTEFMFYAQKSSFLTTKKLMREGKEYYEISGIINEECKKALIEADFLNYIQTVNSDWRYKLYKGDCGCDCFCASKNYVGFHLNSVELKEFEESSVALSNKRLSRITVCGKNSEDIFDILVNLFSVSITKPYELGVPFFLRFALMKEKRQILYFNEDELFVCLSDSEICEMIDEYQIDVQKGKLMKEQSVYHVTTDYFDLSVYDLW